MQVLLTNEIDYNIMNMFLERKETEKYPSLVEGTGLENQEVGNGAGVRIPFSPPYNYRGIEQLGSSPGS